MKLNNIFKRTYYAILLHERNDKLLFEHNDIVQFNLYDTDWKVWYADPIVFKHGEKEWLFVEKMDMKIRLGTIAAAELNENGINGFKEVLKENFHLSYPIVFEKNGHIYMIPESAKQKSIYIYESIDFPYHWKRLNTVLKGKYYADTNIVFYNNHWYLITCEMDPKIGSKTKTIIYNADNIEKGIVEILYPDSSFEYSFNSRGAGNIIHVGERLIRPTQVGNVNHYGTKMNFYNISLNNRYREELINSFGCERISIPGKKKLTGTHTYSLSDRFEIIDIQYTRYAHPIIVLLTIIRKIKGRMKL